ncbi:MAG: peptide deformylase [Weeksellaceae bacterium]|jgi:peptide deformylase|nr:peptide deformylase [Weeksellaceae bacterium]MDX9704527.1 peptide deformylase [Weeksellaceae bacterium]
MRYFFLLSLFCVYTVGFSQEIKPFTSDEIELISESPNEKMRVYNLNNLTDSIVLKSVSIPIPADHDLTSLLARRMLLSVQDINHPGVGIAAPQVGVNRRMIVVQRFDKPQTPFEVFLNPEILWASELMQKGPEGDLSFDERGVIMRHYSIQIRYQTLEGEWKEEFLEGFTSVIFQHERDHLDGILLTDRREEQANEIFQSTHPHYLKK